MPFANSFRDTSFIENSEVEFLNNLQGYCRELADSVEDIKNSLTRVYPEEYLKAAFIAALSKINEVAISIVVTRAIEAAIATGEYNYQPYIDHLVGAIVLNQDELIKITPSPSFRDITVKLDFDILGSVEEWGLVVNKVREDKGLGKTGSAASKIWREKIYAVDREGGRVPKFYKGRGKEKKGSGLKDITDRYKGKYEKTVLNRLSLLDPKKAPFWYLIEFGNVNVSIGSGTPYPSFGETGFVQLTEVELKKRFLQLRDKYYSILELEALTINTELEERITRRVERSLEGNFEPVEELEKEAEKWIRQEITYINERVRVETYLVGSKTRTLARDILTGRFVSLRGL